MVDEDKEPEAPLTQEAAQSTGTPLPNLPSIERELAVSSAGGRKSLASVARELTSQELKEPGVMKLIIENLERADAECRSLRPYVDQFHAADKLVSVLQEKAKRATAVDIFFGAGTGIGGSILALGWSMPHELQHYAVAASIVGALLVAGGIASKMVMR